MGSTILGKLLKKLRVEHNETINDMAEKLDITPSYLSSIGMGKRSLPPHQFELLVKEYTPDPARMEQLFWAAEFSRSSVKINYARLTGSQRQLAAVFARYVERLGENDVIACYRAMQISAHDLHNWCSLFKQNHEFYKPFKHMLDSMQNEAAEHLSPARPSFNAEALREKTDALYADLERLRSMIPVVPAAQEAYAQARAGLDALAAELRAGSTAAPESAVSSADPAGTAEDTDADGAGKRRRGRRAAARTGAGAAAPAETASGAEADSAGSAAAPAASAQRRGQNAAAESQAASEPAGRRGRPRRKQAAESAAEQKAAPPHADKRGRKRRQEQPVRQRRKGRRKSVNGPDPFDMVKAVQSSAKPTAAELDDGPGQELLDL